MKTVAVTGQTELGKVYNPTFSRILYMMNSPMLFILNLGEEYDLYTSLSNEGILETL